MKNKIVLFGGRHLNRKFENNELKIYDLAKSTWSSKVLKGESCEIPIPRYKHTVNSVGDFIFVIGG